MQKTDPMRKCFRMIGGVLVERNVKDVLPALETNLTGVSMLHSLYNSTWLITIFASAESSDGKPGETIQGKR